MSTQEDLKLAAASAVLLAPSPHGVARGYEYVVYEDTVTLHSNVNTVTTTGFGGYYIKEDTIWLFDSQTKTWGPWLSLNGMPEGVWVRFVNRQGTVLIPVELKHDRGGYSGRWLDEAGRLLPLGALDAVRESGEALEAERERHEAFMDSWRRFGGWQFDGQVWIPPRH